MKRLKSRSAERLVSIGFAILIGVFLGTMITAVLVSILWRYQ
jgi:hypothetical protein